MVPPNQRLAQVFRAGQFMAFDLLNKVFMVVLAFELRVSRLLGKCRTT
jgi:hypothetical protein